MEQVPSLVSQFGLSGSQRESCEIALFEYGRLCLLVELALVSSMMLC